MINNTPLKSAVFYRRPAHEHPIIVRGEGVYLFDVQGKRYLDGSSGALVANIGHAVKQVSTAMGEQASQAAYLHGTMFTCQSNENYARELAKICPLPKPKFYFLTSGSEAVEAAIKFARQVQMARGQTRRYLTISRQQSYHGASLGALSITGKPKMKQPFTPLLVDTPKIPPPYCYRCPFNLKYPQCDLRCATALEDEILKVGVDNVCAFIAEPVSGATLGAVVPPSEYWPIIGEICKQYDVLQIVDEVMTGMGRTGKWFATQHWDFQPDIFTIGKGSAAGYFPLSALAVTGEHASQVVKYFGDFIHGGTYSHHAVGCAAGLATLNYLRENRLVEQVWKKGEYLHAKLIKELSPFGWIGDIRGLGLMWGVELVKDKQTKAAFEPQQRISQKIADQAFQNGLIIYPGSGCIDGKSGDHFMIGPPFSITLDQIDEMVELLKQALQAVMAAH